MANNFRTVYDFMRAHSALVVTCRNCDHAAFISARFLKERFDLTFRVLDANFRCRVCGARNVRLSATPEELAITRIDPRMHFAGAYENKLISASRLRGRAVVNGAAVASPPPA